MTDGICSVSENWGEDMVLTSHMGVAFSSGLSKNSTWSDPDAVIPVMKVIVMMMTAQVKNQRGWLIS